MKRVLAASMIVLAFFVVAAPAPAVVPGVSHETAWQRAFDRAFNARFNTRFDARFDRRFNRRFDRRWRARQARKRAQALSGFNSPDLGNVPGVPYSFASCVALRESTDGQGSPNIYGILPMNGYYDGMSLPAQKRLFSSMYQRDGVAPWAPYDGC